MSLSAQMKRFFLYLILGTVDEVAALAVWLCSDACSFNTGAVFDMSGGRATY
jgi:NAD(P)-dependent dehydrogenase (short-subunit alcohol dehydrogenase family)